MKSIIKKTQSMRYGIAIMVIVASLCLLPKSGNTLTLLNGGTQTTTTENADGTTTTVTEDVCNVNYNKDTWDATDSLRRVIEHFFNNATVSEQRCRDRIKINTDVYLDSPITISGSPGPKGTIIEGTKADGKPVVIDISKVGGPCAIMIKTGGITLKNVIIRGKNTVSVTEGGEATQTMQSALTAMDDDGQNDSEDGVADVEQQQQEQEQQQQETVTAVDPGNTDAICVEGKNNTLDNVKVIWPWGRGVVIAQQGNKIINNSGVIGAGEIGIYIQSIGGVNGESVNLLNADTVVFDNNNGRTDEGGQVFAKNSPWKISFYYNFTKLSTQGAGPTKYFVRGVTMKDGAKTTIRTLLVYKNYPNLSKIEDLYSITYKDNLVCYIGEAPQNLSKVDSTSAVALQAAPFLDVPKCQNGKFTGTGMFQFDYSSATNDRLFIVGYPGIDIATSSSKMYALAPTNVDANGNGIGGDVALADGFNSGGTGTEFDDTHFYSPAACSDMSGGYPVTKIMQMDSDDDGIPDALEDMDANCNDGLQDGETNWLDPDTDKDGIPDGREDADHNGFVSCFKEVAKTECAPIPQGCVMVQGGLIKKKGELVATITGNAVTDVAAQTKIDATCGKPNALGFIVDCVTEIAEVSTTDDAGVETKTLVTKYYLYTDPQNGECGTSVCLTGIQASQYGGNPVKTYKLIEPIYREDVGSDIKPFKIPSPNSLDNFGYVVVSAGSADVVSYAFCRETSPRMANSDCDDRHDGLEDRRPAPFFKKDSKAFMYRMRDGSAIKVKNENNAIVKLECTEGEMDMQQKEIGLRYYYGTQWSAPENIASPGDMKAGQYYNVVCRNDSLINTDFNGKPDTGYGETSPILGDSDFDGFADGNGCQNVKICLNNIYKEDGSCKEEITMKPQIDSCASLYDPLNACTTQCSTNMIEERLIEKGTTLADAKTLVGKPVVRADEDKDNVLDMVQDLRGKLPDSDGDGIPDVIENPDGGCGISVLGYNAFNSDTDADGLRDDVDPCPNNNDTTCKGNLVNYTSFSAPIIACFVDRDGDGSLDCEEDLTLDGKDGQIGSYGIPGTIYAYGETNSLKDDTDDDGLLDGQEIHGMSNTAGYKVANGTVLVPAGLTNPTSPDTDGDNMSDYVEVTFDKNPNNRYQPVVTHGTCSDVGYNGLGIAGITNTADTDPTTPDTDSDGISDDFELMKMMSGTISTNPNNPDSDNDGLCDGGADVDNVFGKCIKGEDENQNGKFPIYDANDPSKLKIEMNETNPCEANTDDPEGLVDQKLDINDQCPTNSDPNCSGQGDIMDSDGDGIGDTIELNTTHTNPNEKDTDGDDVPDGCINGFGELCQQFALGFQEGYSVNNIRPDSACKTDWTMCDTDPNNPDTDKDGLNDGLERQLSSNPLNKDTDGDCLTDLQEDTFILSNQPAREADGIYQAGSDLNPLDPDTDDDGLPDGKVGGIGEDLNCSGSVDIDEQGNYRETDPRTGDTDLDGWADYDEMTDNGGFNIANVGQAVTGRGAGCSMTASASADWSALGIIMSLLAGILLLGRARVAVKE